jgi:hypothetical protein
MEPSERAHDPPRPPSRETRPELVALEAVGDATRADGNDRLAIRLEKLETMLAGLLQRQPEKEFYTTAEAAKALGVSPFTVREWCRLRRCHAKKKQSGRGTHPSWVLSHCEIVRLQREGLLPLDPESRKSR